MWPPWVLFGGRYRDVVTSGKFSGTFVSSELPPGEVLPRYIIDYWWRNQTHKYPFTNSNLFSRALCPAWSITFLSRSRWIFEHCQTRLLSALSRCQNITASTYFNFPTLSEFVSTFTLCTVHQLQCDHIYRIYRIETLLGTFSYSLFPNPDDFYPSNSKTFISMLYKFWENM